MTCMLKRRAVGIGMNAIVIPKTHRLYSEVRKTSVDVVFRSHSCLDLKEATYRKYFCVDCNRRADLTMIKNIFLSNF